MVVIPGQRLDLVGSECGLAARSAPDGRRGPTLLTCADLDHLAFLPAGDAALTRRATKASGLSAVVVALEPQPQAVRTARRPGRRPRAHRGRKHCLSDADARARQPRTRPGPARQRRGRGVPGQAWRRRSPGCSRMPGRKCHCDRQAHRLRGSGLVGRSAAGRALDENAITLAVAGLGTPTRTPGYVHTAHVRSGRATHR